MEIHVNYLAVLVAALANYVIGMVWYGALFGRAWKTLAGVSDMKFAPSGVVIYEKKSWKLWMLNNAYWLVSLLVMGAILSGWK
jgi:hypothetical protein